MDAPLSIGLVNVSPVLPSLARDYFIRDTKLPDDNLAAEPGQRRGSGAPRCQNFRNFIEICAITSHKAYIT